MSYIFHNNAEKYRRLAFPAQMVSLCISSGSGRGGGGGAMWVYRTKYIDYKVISMLINHNRSKVLLVL